MTCDRTNSKQLGRYLMSPVVPFAVLGVSLCVLAIMAGGSRNAAVSINELSVSVGEQDLSKTSSVEFSDSSLSLLSPEHHTNDAVFDRLSVPAQHLVEYITRTYRIPRLDAAEITQWAVEIGEAKNLDPLLILAVIATESSFNPQAQSAVGAQGLMQVMTKVHHDKFKAFGGNQAALEPYPNMVVGADILRYLIARTGSVRKGLKWYSGAAKHSSDFGYSAKVLRERSRLMVAAKGNSDKAVTLSLSKKNGPEYKQALSRKTLDFQHWVQVAAVHETKGKSKGAQEFVRATLIKAPQTEPLKAEKNSSKEREIVESTGKPLPVGKAKAATMRTASADEMPQKDASAI